MADAWDLAGLWPGGPEQTTESPAPESWVWAGMPPAEHAQRLRELAEWVQWLVTAHEVHNPITPCWYQHPAVVEHLTALYLGWARAYAGDAGGVSEADWFNTLHALIPHRHLPTCATGTHAPPPPAPPVQPEACADFEIYLSALTRPGQPGDREPTGGER